MEPHRVGHRAGVGSLIGTAGARWAALWRNILHRGRLDDDLDEELRSQLELLVEHHVSRGVPRTEAERVARLEFGGIEQVKEAVRSGRRGFWVDEIVRDVRYGFRSLLRNPTFTVVTVLMIALAIGVNTTTFLVVNGVAFRPFTVPSGDPVLSVTQQVDGEAARHRRIRFERTWVSSVEFDAYRRATHELTDLAAYAPSVTATLAGESPRTLTGTLTSCNYFDVLETRMVLGRGFLDAECAAPGTSAAVVLSHDVWRTAFASEPSVVGRAITLNRRSFTVVGIAPAGFAPPGPIAAAFWAPLPAQTALIPNLPLFDDPHASWLAMLARARPRVGAAELRGTLTVVAADLDRQESARLTRLLMEPARMFDMPNARRAVIGVGLLLLGAVALVLLVACANIANMLLARSLARRHEIGVRHALGASRARLVRQLFTETLLVTAAGGVLGAIFATWSSAALVRALTSYLALHLPIPPLTVGISADGRLLLYTSAVTLLTALACGLLPALRVSRPDLFSDLKQECGGPASHMRAPGGWQRIMLGAQIAVSMVLLLAAGLLLRGLHQAETIQPGFQSKGVEIVRYDLEGAGYDASTAARIQRRLVDGVSALPGVTTAQVRVTPLDGGRLGDRFLLDDGSTYFGSWNVVSPGYFSILGLPIVRGRAFTVADDHAGVAIVTESTARRFWPTADPIGQRVVRPRGPRDREVDEVVGVVKDAQVVSLGESTSTFVYLPITPDEQSNLVLLVRHVGATRDITNELRTIVHAIDPQLVVTISALDDNVELWRSLSRLAVSVSGLLAGLAVALATVGVYGLVAYSVSRRTREIGVRIALGATTGEVARLVVGETMRPVLTGAVAGLVCGAAVARVLSTLLFGLSPYDPISFVAVPLVLIASAGLATCAPGRRAALVDPVLALRNE